MKIFRIWFLFLMVMALQSCATLFNSRSQVICIKVEETVAQKDSVGYLPEEEKTEAIHLLKISPQQMLNLLQPSIELSYEVRADKRLTTQFTAAYMYPRGYRVALEEKFYFNKKAPFGGYVSLGVDFHRNQFNEVNQYIVRELWPDTADYRFAPDSVRYIDSISVERKIFSANLKIGYQGYRGRFVYDMYFGVGYRYRNVVHYDRIDHFDDRIRGLHDFDAPLMEEGKFATPNVMLGFRVGYVFPYQKRAVVEEGFE